MKSLILTIQKPEVFTKIIITKTKEEIIKNVFLKFNKLSLYIIAFHFSSENLKSPEL